MCNDIQMYLNLINQLDSSLCSNFIDLPVVVLLSSDAGLSAMVWQGWPGQLIQHSQNSGAWCQQDAHWSEQYNVGVSWMWAPGVLCFNENLLSQLSNFRCFCSCDDCLSSLKGTIHFPTKLRKKWKSRWLTRVKIKFRWDWDSLLDFYYKLLIWCRAQRTVLTKADE